MKRIFATCLLAVAVALGAAAQNAGDVLNKTIAAYKNVKGISASYVVTSSQGSNSGKIEMKGNKFRITSPDLMCWYDGTTQWAYSTSTGEVNVTEPTAEEMQMSNPYAALASMYVINGSYRISKAYFEMKDGNTFTTKISDYKVVTLSESTFTFDKSAVPAGTAVVDLR